MTSGPENGLPAGLPAPIMLADPHDGIVPHKYVAIARRQVCMCCGAKHEWSELYAWTSMRPQWGVGPAVRNLRHLDWPKYRLPIEQVSVRRDEYIPFCHKCYQPSLDQTPFLKEPPPVDAAKVLRIPPKTEPSVAKPNAAKPSSKSKSTDTLMELLK